MLRGTSNDLRVLGAGASPERRPAFALQVGSRAEPGFEQVSRAPCAETSFYATGHFQYNAGCYGCYDMVCYDVA